jgi:hypothetical protein
MVMKSRQQEILAEAKRHIAESKDFAQVAAPMEDPVRAWARDSEERDRQRDAARRERQEEKQRERRAAERNARRQSVDAIAELRVELVELRTAVAAGDAAVLDVVSSALLPLFDRVADRLDETSAKVDRKLAELEALVRASVSEARAVARFDAATPPAGRREIN